MKVGERGAGGEAGPRATARARASAFRVGGDSPCWGRVWGRLGSVSPLDSIRIVMRIPSQPLEARMWPCRTRPSTSPTETCRSTSERRSSRAATCPSAIAKALRRWVETAEGLGDGYEDVTVRVGPRQRPQGPIHGRPGRRVDGRQPEPRASASASSEVAPASTSSTWSAAPSTGRSTPRASRPAGGAAWASATSGTASSPKESTLEVVDDPRRAPREGPGRAVRHGRARRAPADRGGPRHLRRCARRPSGRVRR